MSSSSLYRRRQTAGLRIEGIYGPGPEDRSKKIMEESVGIGMFSHVGPPTGGGACGEKDICICVTDHRSKKLCVHKFTKGVKYISLFCRELIVIHHVSCRSDS